MYELTIKTINKVNEKIKEVTGLSNLDALFLSEKELNNLFNNCMLLDSWAGHVSTTGKYQRKQAAVFKSLWKMWPGQIMIIVLKREWPKNI